MGIWAAGEEEEKEEVVLTKSESINLLDTRSVVRGECEKPLLTGGLAVWFTENSESMGINRFENEDSSSARRLRATS